MKKFQNITLSIIFLLVFIASFFEISEILMHKQIEGRWNMTAKVTGFYNEDRESLDAIVLGSSHAYCSLDPILFQEESGLSSYVFATQQQPLWITYHYMIEALKLQKPRFIAVEIHMAAYSQGDYLDEATNHAAIDPIPFSKNKIDMIYSAADKGHRKNYIFHIMKYHSRWSQLNKEDFKRTYKKSLDPLKGYVMLEEFNPDASFQDYSHLQEARPALAKNSLYINKIIQLAEKEGIKLLLFKAPSNASESEKIFYNSVAEIAHKNQVPYIDFNTSYHYKAMGIDLARDFYDDKHLNTSGVEKFLPYFTKQLSDLGLLED